jgi:hypothetical protein
LSDKGFIVLVIRLKAIVLVKIPLLRSAAGYAILSLSTVFRPNLRRLKIAC